MKKGRVKGDFFVGDFFLHVSILKLEGEEVEIVQYRRFGTSSGVHRSCKITC